ncbi:hypothetical protein ccbrp13_46640 [Ktedonobacteria bacterium brp13]|nr:hypothetical protein ccbrp13_46640 [Ktedonobacteria bacterium brp13]
MVFSSSYNNELGYPLTLLRLESEHKYAVLEMGAAHLKHFGSVENVAIAKSELVQVLPPEGIALLNYDNPAVRAMKEKTLAHVIYYGLGEGAMVCGQDIEERGFIGSNFTLCVEDKKVPLQLHLPGAHGITTALAAAAVGYAANIPLENICASNEPLSQTVGSQWSRLSTVT